VREKLVGALDSHVEMAVAEFEEIHKPCFHIEALKVIFKIFDALHDVSPVSEFTGEYKFRAVDSIYS